MSQQLDAFDFIRAFVAGGVLFLMGRLLRHYWRDLRELCRVGIGFVGGGLILTLVNSLLGPDTPFQDWAFIVFLAGLGMMFYKWGGVEDPRRRP